MNEGVNFPLTSFKMELASINGLPKSCISVFFCSFNGKIRMDDLGVTSKFSMMKYKMFL